MNIEAYFKITYGLFVVSSKFKEKLNGYISNTVFQVTAEPAQFAVVCSKNNFTAEIIKQRKAFSISVLQKETNPDIIGTFGYKTGKDVDKFLKFKHKTGKTGVPILVEDVIAWFECEVVQVFDVGTHLMFIGTVVDGDLLDETAEPLTYSYYREAKKGKAPKNAPTYIDPEKFKKKESSANMERYYCPTCGYIYDPEIGDPVNGIPPGTSFENLPENWVCPVCGTEKADFIKKTD